MNKTLLFTTVLLGVAVAMAAAHEADSVTVEKQTARVLSAAANTSLRLRKATALRNRPKSVARTIPTYLYSLQG